MDPMELLQSIGRLSIQRPVLSEGKIMERKQKRVRLLYRNLIGSWVTYSFRVVGNSSRG